jgi:hypothetical protein
VTRYSATVIAIVIGVIAAFSVSAEAQTVSPGNSIINWPESSVFVHCTPAGTAGGVTFSVILKNFSYQPVPNFPMEYVVLVVSNSTYAEACETITSGGVTYKVIAHAPANSNSGGGITFNIPWHVGGRATLSGLGEFGVLVYSSGSWWRLRTGSNPNFDQDGWSDHIKMNSTDLNGDGQVSISDLPLYSSDYSGAYNFRSDFNNDGVIDISDTGILASEFGANCP